MRASLFRSRLHYALVAALALPALAGAQSFDAPQPVPYPNGGGALWTPGFYGGPAGGPVGVPYEGLRVDGYPSNRNLNLGDRTPNLGPTVPDRRGAPQPIQPMQRWGQTGPTWGSVQPVPEAGRGDGLRLRGQ